ncbi:MAG: LytTR family transcriptional regulator [Bacteroidales bacterium]|nr:LytTR family transcriptional regulator [Bacteroidales bacterium]MBR1706935.1 LytTR family transcriptional regulator [Bacteroidales bacterium]
MKVKLETGVDLGFCGVVLPALLFIFPLEEWAGWHAGYVLLFILWLYGCYFLDRLVLSRWLTGGARRLWSAMALLFLMTVVTFLMTIQDVPFPKDIEQLPHIELYQQAIWILYIVVTASSLSIGLLARRIRSLEGRQAQEEQDQDTRRAVELRARDAVAGETITVKAGYEDVSIPLAGIQYIESRNNYACIHLDHQDDVVTQITLKALLEQLPEGKFIRIHRSYIIPAYRIERKQATAVKLVGVDTPLPVGRAHKDNLK